MEGEDWLSQTISNWHFFNDFREKDKAYKKKQKQNYDRSRQARDVDPLPDDYFGLGENQELLTTLNLRHISNYKY